jgi:ketosteroid isomerase-like protein
MSDLEARLRRLEDRAALDDLNTRYFLAADGDDLEGVGDSFTEDATFASSGHIGGRSRQGIVDFIVDARRHMGLTIHTPHYGLYTFEADDCAAGIVGAHLELVLAGQATLGAVRYVDEYRREAGQWRIASRDMRTIYMGDRATSAEVFASPTPVQWPGIDPLPTDFPRRS